VSSARHSRGVRVVCPKALSTAAPRLPFASEHSARCDPAGRQEQLPRPHCCSIKNETALQEQNETSFYFCRFGAFLGLLLFANAHCATRILRGTALVSACTGPRIQLWPVASSLPPTAGRDVRRERFRACQAKNLTGACQAKHLLHAVALSQITTVRQPLLLSG
jgi:hypothetical protein